LLVNGKLDTDVKHGASTAQGRPREVVVVLGMHRSGTSLCMNVLNALGIRVDNDLSSDTNNPRGYYETPEIVELNEKLLHLARVNWHTVLSPNLHGPWRDDPALSTLKQRLRDHISEKANRSPEPWAVKDPRICLLLPLYEQLFEQCHLSPIYILCIRDPRSVARSLKRRDNFPALLSELLWLNYTMSAIRVAGSRIKAVVHYEDWFHDGHQQALSLAAGIGLRKTNADQLPNAALEQIIDGTLNHGDGERGTFALDDVERIYRLLLTEDYEPAISKFLEIQSGLSWGMDRISWCQVFWRTKGQDRFAEANSRSVRTGAARSGG
jgi:hypothetical protein